MDENRNYNNQSFATQPEDWGTPASTGYQTQEYQPQNYQQQYYSQQSNFSGQQVPYPPLNGYSGIPHKSKIAAGLLGILIGWLGIHNFYLGYTGKALAQLLISILSFGVLSFISGIWGLIEGILILTSQPGTSWNQDAQGIPLTD